MYLYNSQSSTTAGFAGYIKLNGGGFHTYFFKTAQKKKTQESYLHINYRDASQTSFFLTPNTLLEGQ
jgi:hypothetical protein